jgi:predicted metal-binding protein
MPRTAGPPAAPKARWSERVIATDSPFRNEDLTRIYVCVTCRREGEPDEIRSGARLHAALDRECAGEPGLAVVPVECLSVCKRPCTVSFASAGKWTYVYGDLPPETSAATVRHAATLYAETADGLIPWKLRPDALKKGVVARIPPLPA